MSHQQSVSGQATGKPLETPVKFLTFQLGTVDFGFDIRQVKEIIGMVPVVEVPRMPPFVRGVLNLRGQVIPILDLAERLGMPRQEQAERGCIVIVESKPDSNLLTVGFQVERVTEVLAFRSEDIEPPPGFGVPVDTAFIHGMARRDGCITILLDAGHILAAGEAGAIGQSVA